MDWDPTAGRVGLDWLGDFRQGGVRLDHPLRAVAARVPSTVTETVTAVATHLVNVSGSPTITCEVYDPTTPPGGLVTDIYEPNEDVSFSNTGGTWAGVSNNTVGQRYQNVDETTASSTDYLLHTAGTSASTAYPAAWAFRVNTTADPFGAGSHTVSAIRVRVRAAFNNAGAYSTHVLRLYYTSGGVDYELASAVAVALTAAQTAQVYTFTLATNPATGVSFTEAEIAALDSSTSFKLTSTITHYSAGLSPTTTIDWVSVEVDHRPQPVVATGSAVATAAGYFAITFGSSFSKTSGQDWVFLFRRTSTSGTATIRTLDSGVLMPGGHTTQRPALDAAGAVTDFGDESTEVIALSISISGVLSVDSQPYSVMRRQAVDAANTVVQRITRPSTATVGWLSLVAASSRTVGPSAPLLAKVLNAALVQQGGTATFGVELVEDAPLNARQIDATMASTVSLTNATQYRVELSSTAPEGEGWDVIILGVVDDNGVGDSTANFGSTTDHARLNDDPWTYLDRDVPLAQGTVPTAPSGFTATPSTTGVGSNILAWTATSLAADFARYEIERRDPDGTTWRTIARGLTEATDTYTDYACRRNVAEHYRIRVRHTNGTVSLPSTSDDATCTKTGVYVVSPSNPLLDHRVVPVGNAMAWEMTLERVEEFRYGSDYLAVTKGRRRGTNLSFTILLDEGPESFASQADWVHDLEEADDLALVNEYGERWFVDLSAPAGTSLSPAAHLLPVRVVAISNAQTVVEV